MYKIYTVTEITNHIKKILETDSILGNLSIEGELSSYTVHSSGHIYFSLKDKDSYIKCVMFKGYYRGTPPDVKRGDSVVIKGSIGLYSPRGEYQIYARSIEKSGAGLLAIQFEELKKKLALKGYFDSERKRPIPLLVNKIGIVSGKNAAGFKDMLKILQKENFDVLLSPARVQGKGSGGEIAEGIQKLNSTDVDVIIIGRGGGSIEDLWGFNEECVAEAVYNSEIPVISAVGHEIDFLISDMVADLRAETPTAAAEFLVSRKKELRVKLENIERFIVLKTQSLIEHKKKHLQSFGKNRLNHVFKGMVLNYNKSLALLSNRLKYNITEKIQDYRRVLIKCKDEINNTGKKFNDIRMKLEDNRIRMENHILSIIKEKRNILENNRIKLFMSNPENILKKGYSLTKDSKGNIIKSIKQVEKGQDISMFLSDGIVYSNVNKIKGKE